jgi:hypothetical protein
MEEDPDSDLQCMSERELFEEVLMLRNGIRKHRDATGHSLCWYVPELWNLLPERVVPQPTVPPKEKFIRCCKEYRDSLDHVTVEEQADSQH